MLQDKIIEVARSHLKEHESGEGNTNEGAIVDWSFKNWTKRSPEDGTNWASWCAGFVSTCILTALEQLNIDTKDWKKRGSLLVSGLYKKNKDWFSKEPHIGDIIIYTHNGEFSHVGIVELIDTKVKTIEGNVSNMVDRRDHDLKDPNIFGYINIKYTY
jgi:hypothetical protein